MNRATTTAAPQAPSRATLDDLMRTPGKAELIGGRIVTFMATGHLPSRIASRIFRSLDDHAEATGHGLAYNDNVGFAVPELNSGRQSFSPDASYYLGPIPSNGMDFLEGPPALAVEVRSKSDYGPAAEAEQAAKRADYFEAGTRIVWDVDPIAEWVRVYRRETPDQGMEYRRGGEVDAEPVIAGWRVRTAWIFG